MTAEELKASSVLGSGGPRARNVTDYRRFTVEITTSVYRLLHLHRSAVLTDKRMVRTQEQIERLPPSQPPRSHVAPQLMGGRIMAAGIAGP